jgi:membrane fusion protein, multidrug efflux system
MGNDRKLTLSFKRVLGLVFLSAIISSGCKKESPPVFERPPAPVTVVASVTQNVPVYIDAIGKCVAREVVSVQAQVSGSITAIHFTDGGNVKTGDLLFTIDTRPFEADLQRAQANLAKDTALKKQAEANLQKDVVQARNGELQAERYARLVQQGVVSKEQHDQLQTNAEALQATVNADRAAIQSAEEAIHVDKAAIETAKVQLSYCYIRSPIEGRAGQRLVDLGNVINTLTPTPLLVIQRLDPIYADFAITQNELSIVQRNMALGKMSAEVRLPDEPENPRSGQITFLDNFVQDGTGTVKLRALIPNSDHRFWPGRFVKVRLVLSMLQGAVLVPTSAPQMSANGPFVYVVKEDSTAELRSVTLGQRHGDLVVINQGLNPGERVVINGQIAVTPGSKVRIEETRSPVTSLPPATGGKS